MAANCDVCGKGPGFGHSISHSHRRTKRRWNPNIQTVRAMVGKTPKKLFQLHYLLIEFVKLSLPIIPLSASFGNHFDDLLLLGFEVFPVVVRHNGVSLHEQ